MKKAVKMAAIFFVTFLTTTDSFGQVADHLQKGETASNRDEGIATEIRTPVYSKMKTEIVAILEIIFPETGRQFAAIFPLAINPVWIMDNGKLFVSFLKDGNRASAVFTTSGVMKYSIIYLKPSDIPAGIIEKIRAEYEEYSIMSIKEITIKRSTIYQVIVENVCEYITIQVNYDEIEEKERVKKRT